MLYYVKLRYVVLCYVWLGHARLSVIVPSSIFHLTTSSNRGLFLLCVWS